MGIPDYPVVSMEILKYLVSLSIPMSQKTMVDSRTQNQKQGMSDTALENLTAIEDEIEMSSQYFKPKPDKVYMISINPEERISPRLNDDSRLLMENQLSDMK